MWCPVVALCSSVVLGAVANALPNAPAEGSPSGRSVAGGRSSVRILPLGASITYGQGSSDGNGYRKRLQDLLQRAGTAVDMVGTVSSGTMKDNQNEGHPGALVHQVAAHAEKDLHIRPNLVLIKEVTRAGTNDAIRDVPKYPLDSIEQRMDKLLDRLFDQIPGVTIILSTLLPNADPKVDHRIRTVVNPKYRATAEARRRKGGRIVLADMCANVTKADLGPDGTHPSDTGYRNMASVWYQAVMEAVDKDMLKL